MPITRKQFELEIDPRIEEWMKRIHAYLVERKDEAFTEEELKDVWKRGHDPRTWAGVENKAVDEALAKLVELGSAQARRIRGVTYYSFGLLPLKDWVR